MATTQSGFENIVLAMDLSLSAPGFAVLATEDNGRERLPILLDKSYVTTSGTHGAKLFQISGEIDRLLTQYSPEHIVREKGFSRFAATTQALFKVVGAADLAVYRKLGGKAIAEISPTSVKKAITGGGKADKSQVADAVFRLLQIDNKSEFYRKSRKGDVLIDDMTDACAVGIAYLKQEGLIA